MIGNNFSIFYKATMRIFALFILGIIIFTIMRTLHLLSYSNFSELNDFKLDLLHAYWVGFRFDSTVLAHGFFFVFFINLLSMFLPRKTEKNGNTLRKVCYWYVVSVFSAFVAILIADFFYYMFFHSHFNKLVFGVADEPEAVLTSVWTDYPLTRIFIFYAGFMLILAYVIRKIFNHEHKVNKINKIRKILFVAASICLYLLALRGSTGALPITQHVDSYISSNLFLNDLTMNGVYSLKEAFTERLHDRIPLNIPFPLRESSFFSIQNPGNTYDSELMRYTDDPDLTTLPIAETPKNVFLEENPPHVVFVLMESMSNYYLDIHSPSLNLLGSLEKQLNDSIMFRNFLSSGNSTAQSLIGLLINNPFISYVEAQKSLPDESFSSSVAIPYAKAGYSTSFITGEDLTWIGLDAFMQRQYFQSVEGQEIILSEIKGAEANTSGVYDEFIFSRALNKLEKSEGKPQFIFVLTSSNHTPFDLPDSYKPFPVEIPAELAKRIKPDKEMAEKNFTGYQYANDSLGRFLEKLKSSPLGANTIVVATGDHSTQQLFHFPYTQLLQQLSVPLIMHIPDKYMPPGEVDTSRFASHKDVFPSIYNLSLSGEKYLRTGNNLFESTRSTEKFFAINDNRVAMSEDGVILIQEKPFFYRWQEGNTQLLEPTTMVKSAELKRLLRKSASHILHIKKIFQSDLLYNRPEHELIINARR